LEGNLHKSLKDRVANELQKQKFSVYYEPLKSPLERLWWDYYRPDILALKNLSLNLKVVLVECETKPNLKRLLKKTSKIQHYLFLQKMLDEKVSITPLLVIPPFNLNKIISCKVRKLWEIWIINNTGKILDKISRVKNCN
jgi:hypothetical protein